MTCREKLKLEHPDKIDNECGGGCHGCPSTYGYLPTRDTCDGFSCWDCWDQEIPETLPTQYKIDTEAEAELNKPEPMWPKDNPSLSDAAKEAIEEHRAHILDSGDRTEFATGAVRDMREGKGRCDLMPLEVASHMLANKDADDQVLALVRIFQRTGSTEALYIALDEFKMRAYDDTKTMLLEVAKHFEEGAKKYGENNWQKGIPVHCYIDSAVRHYLKWLRGDKDEPHDRAFVWNLMCCIWEVDYHQWGEKEVNEAE